MLPAFMSDPCGQCAEDAHADNQGHLLSLELFVDVY
jgi:hypothetical protein